MPSHITHDSMAPSATTLISQPKKVETQLFQLDWNFPKDQMKKKMICNLFLAKSRAIVALSTHFGCF